MVSIKDMLSYVGHVFRVQQFEDCLGLEQFVLSEWSSFLVYNLVSTENDGNGGLGDCCGYKI